MKCFLFMVGSLCHIKQFITGVANISPMMNRLKWRCRSGFRRTVKAMLVKDMSRNKCFFQVWISDVLGFISICDPFSDSPL
jgi:hypothetical protein